MYVLCKCYCPLSHLVKHAMCLTHDVMHYFHDHDIAGHPGAEKIKRAISQYFT